jgi:ribosome-binding factor A
VYLHTQQATSTPTLSFFIRSLFPFLLADAARVHRALTAVLSSDASLREALIHDVGLTIKDIRVSPDHTKAFVLWESFMGRGAATAAALQRHLPRLKAGVAKAMAARRVPRLEFRRDEKGSEIEALERTLDQIDEEFAADAAENTP